MSILIPTYNNAPYILAAIDSALNQSYPNTEVIVVDDKSTDNTLKVLEPLLKKITLIQNLRNEYLPFTRNVSMSHAKGKYVAWLDSDDIWNKNKIAIQVRLMELYPDAVLTCSDFSAFNEEGLIERSHICSYYDSISRYPGKFSGIYTDFTTLKLSEVPWCELSENKDAVSVYRGEVFDKLVFGNFIHPPSVMLRSSVTAKLDDLDVSLGDAGDWEYFIRVAQRGSVIYVDHPLMQYRYSKNQMSSGEKLGRRLESTVKVFEKLSTPSQTDKRIDQKMLQRKRKDSYAKAAWGWAYTHHKYRALSFIKKAIIAGCVNKTLIMASVFFIIPRSWIDLYRTAKKRRIGRCS